jgi:hypothetical protein
MQITRSVMGAVGVFTALCGAVGLAASFDRCKVLLLVYLLGVFTIFMFSLFGAIFVAVNHMD